MTFFSRPPRMPMPQQQFRGAPPMPRQRFGNPMQNAFPPQRNRGGQYPPFYPQTPNYGPWQPPYNPYEQMPGQGYGGGGGGLSDNLNTIMGHVGTVTNGINAMQQVGSLMNLFRV